MPIPQGISYGKGEVIMKWISRNELRKLAMLCDQRQLDDELIRDNAVDGANYDYGERCIADKEACYMKSLSAKLIAIADSDAKRVEIVF
jgi:hypothetical protein